MMTEEQIKQKIVELKAARDAFVSDANLKLAEANGQIAALELIIAPVAEEPATIEA